MRVKDFKNLTQITQLICDYIIFPELLKTEYFKQMKEQFHIGVPHLGKASNTSYQIGSILWKIDLTKPFNRKKSNIGNWLHECGKAKRA